VPLAPIPRAPPRAAETKDSAAPLERTQAGAALFQGYASVFDVVDLGRDMVLRGAFAESLARRGTSGVRMLWQHDPAQPIGAWHVLREDARGLFVRGALNLGVARGREVFSLLRQGALDGLSIGFKAVGARTDPRSGIRRLSRIDLWEISLVTFPLLPQARVLAVEGGRAAAA
jgi:hypothetical protein